MPYTTSPIDGAQLFYKDYRPTTFPVPFQPEVEGTLEVSLVFLHGWPMSSAMWEHLMLPLCESHRIRGVAVDRRGFGKSEWSGTPRSSATEITYSTFAKDTIHVLEKLDLKKFVFVAASMGCGETLLAYFGSEWVRERCKVRNHSTMFVGIAKESAIPNDSFHSN
jgi:non-heme chloroperoxidase